MRAGRHEQSTLLRVASYPTATRSCADPLDRDDCGPRPCGSARVEPEDLVLAERVGLDAGLYSHFGEALPRPDPG
jgi:hypothetical protein